MLFVCLGMFLDICLLFVYIVSMVMETVLYNHLFEQSPLTEFQ